MKPLHLFFLVCIASALSCRSQKPVPSGINFNEITFHSSRCNGMCPDISMNITSDSNIQLMRTIYLSKSQEDTIRSGGFKGKLNAKDYSKLMALLNEVDWKTVRFPDVTCCDGVVVQILLTYDNDQHRFKSMSAPPETRKLIDFLTHLAVTIDLPRYDKPMDFEEILR